MRGAVMVRKLLVGIGALGLVGLACWTQTAVIAQRGSQRQPGEAVGTVELRTVAGLQPNGDLLFNGWGVSPAGEHVRLQGDMPLEMVVAPDGRALIAVQGGFSNQGVSVVSLGGGRTTQFVPLERAWNGAAFSRDGKRLFVTGGNSGELHVLSYADGRIALEESVEPAPDESSGPAGAQPRPRRRRPGAPRRPATPPADPTVFLAGIAVHPETGKLYVCNEANHEVWVVDPESLEREAVVPVGQHPHSLAFGGDRRHLYVSNWGSRSVSVIDTRTARRVRDITVGLRPNDVALSPDGRLFVACSGDNTVHVVQTRSLERPEAPADPTRRIPEGTREILSTSLYPSSPEGSTPVGVAVSPDGKTLYVANADNNDVMVVDIENPIISEVEGFIPTGWYPTAVAVSPDNRTVFIGNGKGLRSRANHPPQTSDPRRLHKPPTFDYIGRIFEGSVSVVRRPESEDLARLTQQVRRNSPYTPETLRQAPVTSNSVIPDQVGEPCPIKHVLYIIKENRTYDQLLGDFRDAKGRRAGNGDPNLVMYGEDVGPNHHQLARDYVLLDNLYCNGEVSVDGHSWSDAAIATDYNQRRWIMSYSQHGQIPGNDEMEVPSAGYLWDLCRRHGISYKNYGEGAARVPTVNRGTWPAGRDMNRVDGWIADLKRAEQTGDLPRFMIMSLGEDHTRGTTPGANTPDACVASNDIGLGKIVEAASRSKFWKEMAIFVIEDDAQNGPDHVDAHRTVGLVISPWARRGVVDSTLYTTASMIRTMELILGLPPLTQYDAGATPMFNSFQKRSQLTAYIPKTPRVDVNAINAATAPGARASARMDWSEYDRIPEDPLNRILWRAAKGPNVPYPAPIHRAVFTR
jgi:YVTN family beta-propeller protein